MVGRVKTFGGSHAGGFRSIYSYITRAGDVADVAFGPALDVGSDVPAQMEAVVNAGTGRVRTSPAYHLVLSWDRPIRSAEAFACVERGIDKLGLGEHQWVAALHRDTEHVHTHVLVNRVHPETHRAWLAWRDYRTLQAFAREETAREREAGLLPPQRPASQISVHNRAGDAEVWTGQISLERWAKQEVAPLLQRTITAGNADWQRVHDGLADYGLVLESTGSGLALVDRSTPRPRAVAASHAGLGLPLLEQRLGPFRPPSRAPSLRFENAYGTRRKRYELPTPLVVDPIVAPLYASFVAEHASWRDRQPEIQRTRERVRADYRRANERERQRDRSIDRSLAGLRGEYGRVTRQVLRELSANERAERRRDHLARVGALTNERPASLFRVWLKQRRVAGDMTAGVASVFLRNRSIQQADISNIEGAAIATAPKQDPDITALVERYTAARHAGKPVVPAVSADEFTEICRHLSEYGRLEGWIAGNNERALRFAGEDISGLNAAAAAVILRDVLPEEQRKLIYAGMEPVVPFASFRELAHDEIDVPSRSSQVPEAEISDELLLEGELRGVTHGYDDDSDVDIDAVIEEHAELETIAERYRTYLEATGKPLYARQERSYQARSERVDRQYQIRDRGQSGGDALRRLKAHAALAEECDVERETIATVTGFTPPLSLPEWLETSEFSKEARERFLRAYVLTPDAFEVGFQRELLPQLRTSTDLLAHAGIDVQEDGSSRIAWKNQRGFSETKSAIHVNDAREHESAQLALLVAAAKFEHGVELSGTQTFVDHILRVAVDARMERVIVNPELQERIAELVATRSAPEVAMHQDRVETAQRQELDMASTRLSPDDFRQLIDTTLAQTLHERLEARRERPIATELLPGEHSGELMGVYGVHGLCYALIDNGETLSLVSVDPSNANQLYARNGQPIRLSVGEDGCARITVMERDHSMGRGR